MLGERHAAVAPDRGVRELARRRRLDLGVAAVARGEDGSEEDSGENEAGHQTGFLAKSAVAATSGTTTQAPSAAKTAA
jgi:hypothetical protein